MISVSITECASVKLRLKDIKNDYCSLPPQLIDSDYLDFFK